MRELILTEAGQARARAWWRSQAKPNRVFLGVFASVASVLVAFVLWGWLAYLAAGLGWLPCVLVAIVGLSTIVGGICAVIEWAES